ncbi:15813_t:CDS:2 [Acaulospora morrowiae]|uniref:NADH dehydrogenase [ubiquinone] 1 alpha subcomplex subunit 1 n=1 Tax=Acaulospora morrowiae TaxID=94023 RepID=A0A9N9FG96_9GLOM|nr:15813_t:CDS:2 [Acaulospora morrowiae]
MPVPYGALIPLGIITAMFGVSGSLLHLTKTYAHEGKPPRYCLDNWDKQMMERDKRLTGSPHRQTSEPIAPKEFTTNSVWYLTSKRILWQ